MGVGASYLSFDVIRDTLWKLHHVLLILEYGDKYLVGRYVCIYIFRVHLLDPGTEMVQCIRVDVPKGKELTEVKVLVGDTTEEEPCNLILWYRSLFSFYKVDSLVTEPTWPISVDVKVTGNVLRDDHGLWQVLVKERLAQGTL